jgi:hypothetical protein
MAATASLRPHNGTGVIIDHHLTVTTTEPHLFLLLLSTKNIIPWHP